MFSKFLKPAIQVRSGYSLLQRKSSPLVVVVRRSGELVPPTQYDVPIPRKLHLSYALTRYWEIIPLFFVTMTSLSLMCASIAWACRNKVDVVFSSRSRDNISRTMDLRKPTIHKLVVINDRYEPWPEMQAALDKMVEAEKRALSRLASCSYA
ncbi:PREDICTED: uncharacterized protein LOC106104257 [Papilio polytes]|uniref:uncharacterized protein LOC106104257 n=1 Tax=Papilio polytes TaxID=76194 RepID=UPI0006769ADB|nr:PREDICTED: uncharacterized protein LOC106104257 [Papilio polytes]